MHNCPVCKSDSTSLILHWGRFDIHLCKSCKLVFSTPLPSDEELTEFYNGFLFNQPKLHEIAKRKQTRKKELIRLFNVSKGENKPILDHGGGTGSVYQAAKELGFDAYYFDMDEQARQFTIKTFELDEAHDLSKKAEFGRSFDYIFSDNVIEHVKFPIEFTQVLVNALNPNGTLVIKTPHARNTEIFFNPVIALAYMKFALKRNSVGGAVKATLKRFWHCDPPRHIYSFSKKSLQVLASELKGEIVSEILYYDVPMFRNTLTRAFFKKDSKYGLLKGIAFRLVMLPFLPVEWGLQSLKWLLIRLKVVTPGGIILKIRKK